MTGPATVFDKPTEYIGKSIPRSDASRLLRGKGHYVDDIQLPRMVHAVFLRSPHAHANIISIDIKRPVVTKYKGDASLDSCTKE